MSSTTNETSSVLIT